MTALAARRCTDAGTMVGVSSLVAMQCNPRTAIRYFRFGGAAPGIVSCTFFAFAVGAACSVMS